MITGAEQEFHIPEPPLTYVQRVLEEMQESNDLPIHLINLSETPVLAPGYGVYVGEKQYAIGSSASSPEYQYQVTDRVLHCTVINVATSSMGETISLFAHLFRGPNAETLLQRFYEELGSPHDFDMTIIPGYQSDSFAIARLQELIRGGISLGAKHIAVDIASGNPFVERGIIKDVFTGKISQLSSRIEPEQKSGYNTTWAKYY